MKNKVLFIHTGDEQFVKIDRELLNSSFELVDFFVPRKFPIFFNHYIKMVKESDITFAWFASWNSMWAMLFSRLLHKPSVLVIGGYDLAKIPEIGYGSQRGGLKKWVSRLAIKLASVLITNSYYSQKEAFRNVGISSERINVIYHGVPDLYEGLNPKNENLVLTVGNIDHANLLRKGLEPFVRAAAFLPELQFVLVGSWKDDSIQYLKSIASSNVFFTGFISDEELIDYYKKASVYVQASAHEGFGMSVAEAMLAGCIPVVTKAGSLPEVVGDTGIIADSAEAQSLVKAINTAISSTQDQRERARQRILNLFTMEKRGQSLKQIILTTMEKVYEEN